MSKNQEIFNLLKTKLFSKNKKAKSILTILMIALVLLSISIFFVLAETFTVTIHKPEMDNTTFSIIIPAINASTGSAATSCNYTIENGSVQLGPVSMLPVNDISHESANVSISFLQEGAYNISVFCWNFSDVTDNATANLSFNRVQNNLAGYVKYLNNDSVADYNLTLMQEGRSPNHAVTDVNGYYNFSNIEEGLYSLHHGEGLFGEYGPNSPMDVNIENWTYPDNLINVSGETGLNLTIYNVTVYTNVSALNQTNYSNGNVLTVQINATNNESVALNFTFSIEIGGEDGGNSTEENNVTINPNATESRTLSVTIPENNTNNPLQVMAGVDIEYNRSYTHGNVMVKARKLEGQSINVDVPLIKIHLVSPPDNNITSDNNVSFLYNISRVRMFSYNWNCTLVLDGENNETDPTHPYISNETPNYNGTINATLDDEQYNWTINCTESVEGNKSYLAEEVWNITHYTPPVNLTVVKYLENETVNCNSTIPFIINVTNNEDHNLTNITINDTIGPSTGFFFQNSFPSPTVVSDHYVYWTIPNLEPGANYTIRANFTSSGGSGNRTNTVEITNGTGGWLMNVSGNVTLIGNCSEGGENLTIELIYPPDEYNFVSPPFVFNYSIMGMGMGNDSVNCSLWGNFTGEWALNQTSYNITIAENNSNNSFSLSSLNNGSYVWNINCSFYNSSNSSWADNRTFSVGGEGGAPYVFIASLAYDGTPLPYVNISGEIMLFAGETVEIKGDVNDTDLANWTISLKNSSGIVVNSSLCFNISIVNSTFCSWNTSKYCLEECENYTLILNASDSAGHTNSTFLGNITIDNSPPSVRDINATISMGMPPSWTGDANISDNYLMQVDGLILDENNFLVTENVRLCNKSEENCTSPGSGEFNYSWQWDTYSLNGSNVPVVLGGFFTDYSDTYIAIVPGCFAPNGTNYDCGGLCANQSICFEYKWALVYNMSTQAENRTLLGLTNAQLCSQEGCLVNTTVIQNATSKFKPQSETLNFSTIEWSFENMTEITLYNVNGSYNLNLSFETPEAGNYNLVFMAQDYFWITVNNATDYLNLSGGGLSAELNDVANNMGFVSGIVNITGYVNGTNLTNWNVSISNLSGPVNSSLCSGNSSVNGTLCSWYTSQYCSGECANYTVMLNATGLGGNASSLKGNIIIDNHSPNISILLINTSDSNDVFARANISDGYLYEVRAYVFNSTNKTIMEWGRFCGEEQEDACQEILQGTFNRTWGKRIYQLNNSVLSVSNKWSFNGTNGTILVPGCFAQDGSNYDCGGVCANLSVCLTYRWWLAYNDSQDGNKSLIGISNDMLCGNGCQLNNSAIINGTSQFKIQTDKRNFSSGEWYYENLTNITLYGIGNLTNLNVTSSNINEGNFTFAFEAVDRAGWGSLTPGNFSLIPSQQENTNFSLNNTILNSQRPNLGDTIRFLINVTNTGSVNISNLSIVDAFNVSYNYTNASVIPNTINYTNYTLSWNNISVNQISQNQSYLLYVNFSALSTVHNAFNTVNLTVYYESGGSSTTSNSFSFDIAENVSPNIEFVNATTIGEGNYSGSSIWANVSVNDSNMIDTIIIFLFNSSGLYNSSTTNLTGDPSGYFFVNFTNLPEGTYRLNATVNDTWGNPNSTGTRIITLDRTVPYVTWISPANANYTQTNITINITNNSDASLIWWNNGTDNLTYTAVVVYNFSQGSHTVVAYANDSAGNMNSSSRTFFIDSIVPIVDFESGTETSGTIVNRQNIIINATASDSGIGLKNVTIYLYNSSGLVSSNTSTSSPLFWNITSLGDGVYYFNATAYDNLGNFNYTGTRNVTVSAVSPMITIITPLNQTYNTTTIVFNISLSEQGSWCGLSLDGTANASMTVVGNLANYTNSSMTQGSHNVTFYCNDSDGNLNLTSARYFFIDSIAPTYSNNLTSPTSPATYSSSQSYQFNITWNETNSIGRAILIFNGSNYTMDNSGSGSNYSYTFSSLTAGNYTYSFWANDSAGNSNQTTTLDYTINKANPTITTLLNGVTDNLTIAYPNQVNASGSTTGGTIIIYRNDTQINNSLNYTLGADYYKFDFNVTGNENYSSGSVSLFASVTKATSVVILYLNNSRSNITVELGNSVWINATNTSQGNIYLYKNGTLINNGTSPLANYTLFNSLGMWNITAIYPATQNYSSSSETWWVNVTDTTAPTITLPSYTNATLKKNTDTLTLNISVTDADTPQSPCFIDVNATNQTIAYSNGWCNGTVALTGLGDGNETIKVYDNDSSGNMRLNNSYVVWIDTTAPTITHNSPSNNSYYNYAPYFNGTCTDSGSGFSKIWTNLTEYPTILSSSPYNFTNTSALTEKGYIVNLSCNDSAGNLASVLFNFTYDKTNPAIAYNPSSTDSGNYSRTWIFVNVSCADTNKNTIVFNWNGTNTTFDSNDGNNYWSNKTTLSDGSYTFYSWCNDSAGNSNGTSVKNVVLDTNAPTVTHNSPTNNSYYNYAPYFNGTCADAGTGVSSMWTNLTEYIAIDTSSPYNFTNVSGLTAGVYPVLILCNDTANNTATSMFYFTFDATNPTSTINAPANMTNTTDNTFDVNITLKDNIALAISYTFFINDIANKTGILTNNTATNITMDALSDGIHRIKVQATDNSTNKVNSSEYWYTVDTTSPTISFGTNPVDNYNSNSSNVTFDITCSDNVGVNTIQLWTNTTGTWAANYSNSSYINHTWLNITVTGIPQGQNYKWAVYCNDTSGNSNITTNRTLNVDLTAPIASVGTNPIDNYNDTDNSIVFDMKCSDNVDVSYIQLWTNITGNWSANYTNSSYTSNTWLNITVAGIPDSQNIKWLVYCNDTSGNTNMTDNRTFREDTTAPHITVFSPGNTSYFTVQNITVNFSATDLTNVSSLWYSNTTDNVSANNGTYNLTNGSYTFIFYANDTLNNVASRSITFTVKELEDNQTILNESNPTVGENTTEIILPQNQSLSTITIPSDRAEDDLITLNLGQRVDSDGNLSFGSDVNLSRVSSSANYTVEISSDVVIMGGPDWTGEFILPTIKSTSGLDAPSISGYTTTLEKVITLGSSTEINFSSPVKIVVGGMGGKKAAWARGSTSFTDISTICDNLTNPTLNLSVRECYNNTGADLIIWTLHFTDFAAYSSTEVVSNPPGGGGGGGGGSGNQTNATNETKPSGYNYTIGHLDGKSRSVRIGLNEVLNFGANGEDHLLKVTALTNKSATLMIWSGVIQIILDIGETRKIDLNGNGYDDLEITLMNISGGKANLVLKELIESGLCGDGTCSVIEEESGCCNDCGCEPGYECKNNTCEVIKKPSPPSIWMWIGIIFVVVLLLLVAIFASIRSKNKRNKKR
ncbi:MAG: hypothetical protein NTX24_05355 [Candidatus Pacearchaeota archaeon]|nr:hypothetical protein [Candidatus Pacearchaeota archaeon]